MKKIITTALALSSMIGFAQDYKGKVGINTDQPEATLEIIPNKENAEESATSNEGILIPKLSKERVANMKNPTTALLVYINNPNYNTRATDPAANSRVENIIAEGFHYYDGTTWQPIQKTTLVTTVSPKFDYVLSADGSVLMQWMNKYTENIDMNTYADMADVKVISQYLLNGSKVKSFTIRNGVTTVGQYAFADNPNMEFPTLPTSITTIENSAFTNNKKISQVHLPNLTTIGEYAFNNNTAITSVDLPIIKEISMSAFYGNTALTNLSLPQATMIGVSAFADNTSLKSVSLPQATTTKFAAFADNTSLKSISLPQATTIGGSTFKGCTALTSVKLSSSIKEIGNGAFSNIAPNAVITIESTTPPTLGDDVFDYTTTIKVPSASVQAYKTAWAGKVDTNKIEGY